MKQKSIPEPYIIHTSFLAHAKLINTCKNKTVTNPNKRERKWRNII